MSPGDDRFAQTMADLSSRLRDRMAQQPRPDPITALKNRQAALRAFDQERRQKLYLIGGGLGCVVAAGALAWGIVMFAQPDQTATSMPDRAATVAPVTPPPDAPAAPAKLAAATPPPTPAPAPAPAPPEVQAPPPPAPVNVEATTVPAPDPRPGPAQADAKPVEQAAVPAKDTTPSNASPADRPPPAPPLSRREIAEAQQLLAEFGFHPGPVDGSAGPRTLDAVSRYQQRRGLAETGVLDGGLLQQLRQDPSPRTVMVAQQPPPSLPRYAQTQSRTPSVFRPVEMAGQQITTWLNSVFR